MTFEETLQFLREQQGRWIAVAVGFPRSDEDATDNLASFSGQIGRVRESGARNRPEAWNVWLMAGAEPGPHPGVIRLSRELFGSADVSAQVPDAPGERAESGTMWTLTVWQRGVRMVIDVYV